MDQPGAESGTEFVLDSRKLIIVFFLLIGCCGVFFILGFREGKRQAIQVAAAVTPPGATRATPAVEPDSKQARERADAEAGQDKSVREQLDWFNRVYF